MSCQLFERSIKVVGVGLGSEGEEVKNSKEFEGRAGSDRYLRGWIDTTAEELMVVRNGSAAPTVSKRHFVYSIYVQDEHPRVSGNWIVARCVGVVELNCEAQRLEGDDGKMRTILGPFLREDTERQHPTQSILARHTSIR